MVYVRTEMFQEFSAGYRLGRLYVTPSAGSRAVMQKDQHERANEELYATGEGVERLDAPLVVKLENRHIPVHGEGGLPDDTLAVPGELLDDTRIRNPPTLREVLVAKADTARRLLRWQGGVDAAPGDDGDGGPDGPDGWRFSPGT